MNDKAPARSRAGITLSNGGFKSVATTSTAMTRCDSQNRDPNSMSEIETFVGVRW